MLQCLKYKQLQFRKFPSEIGYYLKKTTKLKILSLLQKSQIHLQIDLNPHFNSYFR